MMSKREIKKGRKIFKESMLETCYLYRKFLCLDCFMKFDINNLKNAHPELSTAEIFFKFSHYEIYKIFSYLTEQDICRFARVCKSFQECANNSIIWRLLLQRVYGYEEPYAIFNSKSSYVVFKNILNISEYHYFSNKWKKSLVFLYQGVHVCPSLQNFPFRHSNLQCFNTIKDALNYVNSNRNDTCSQHLIFIHAGTYNETVRIETDNVALIGFARGRKVAESVILQSEETVMHVKEDLKRVYVKYLTLKLLNNRHVCGRMSANYCLEVGKNSNPIIEHCIIKNYNIRSAAVYVGQKAEPLIEKCDISYCKNIGLYLCPAATTECYEDDAILCNAKGGIWLKNFVTNCQNRIYHQYYPIGIYISDYASGCFKNNQISRNGTGFFVTNSMNLTILKNDIYNNYNGVHIFNSSTGLVKKNRILYNMLVGINFTNSNISDVKIQKNKAHNNYQYIFKQNAFQNLVEENKIYTITKSEILKIMRSN